MARATIDGEDGEEEAAAAQEDVDVVPEVGLALRRGLVGGLGRRRRHHTFGLALGHGGARCAKPLRALGIVAEKELVSPEEAVSGRTCLARRGETLPG